MFEISKDLGENYNRKTDHLQRQLQQDSIHIQFAIVKTLVQPNFGESMQQINNTSAGSLKRNWKRKNFANFFIAWLNFTNFLLILPFRVVRNDACFDGTNEKVEEYVIKNNRVQQVISALFHISTLLIYFGEFRITIVNNMTHNPVEFLSMFDKIATLLHNFVLMYIMWRKSPKFLLAVNKLAARKSMIVEEKSQMLPSRWVAVTIMGIYALFALITPLLLSDQFSSFDLQIAKFEERIKYHFFLTSEKPSALFHATANSSNTNLVLDLIASPEKIPSLALFCICFAFRSFMGSFTDALVLVTALSLWHPVKEFSEILRKSISEENANIGFADAVKEYRKLKELSIAINDAVQTVVFTFVVQAIFFYSTRLKEWITNCGSGTLYLSFFFISFFFMFYFASDVCKQVDQFRLFIYQMNSEDRKFAAETDIMVLLHELSSSPIGISGKGRFVINYSFVASMCSTLLTYFIVTVQSGE